jgi:hypothetical protein
MKGWLVFGNGEQVSQVTDKLLRGKYSEVL